MATIDEMAEKSSENDDNQEQQEVLEDSSSSGTTPPPTMTLQKAIEMGEYDPEYLATFPEWHTLTKHIQWQFINKALENRDRQYMQQYAAVNNVLDFSKKPEAQAALKNLEIKYKEFREEREKILIEYSS